MLFELLGLLILIIVLFRNSKRIKRINVANPKKVFLRTTGVFTILSLVLIHMVTSDYFISGDTLFAFGLIELFTILLFWILCLAWLFGSPIKDYTAMFFVTFALTVPFFITFISVIGLMFKDLQF